MTSQKGAEAAPYLSSNPFWMLSADPEISLEHMADAHEGALEDHAVDERTLRAAYQVLSTPSRRLSAELSWLVGVPADAVKQFLEGDTTIDTSAWPPLAIVNAVFDRFAMQPDEARAAAVLDAWRNCDDYDSLNLINSIREKAGIPIATRDAVSKQQTALQQVHLNAILRFGLVQEASEELFTRLSRVSRDSVAPDDVSIALLERYASVISSRLSLRNEEIFKALDSLTDATDEEAEAAITQLDDNLKEWMTEVYPLYLLELSRGLTEPNTRKLVEEWIRRLPEAARFAPPENIDRLRRVDQTVRRNLEQFLEIKDVLKDIGANVDRVGVIHAARLVEPDFHERMAAVVQDGEGFAQSVQQGAFHPDGQGPAYEVFSDILAVLTRHEDPRTRSGLWFIITALIETVEKVPGVGDAQMQLASSLGQLLEKFPPESYAKDETAKRLNVARCQHLLREFDTAGQRGDKASQLSALDRLVHLTLGIENRVDLSQGNASKAITFAVVALGTMYIARAFT